MYVGIDAKGSLSITPDSYTLPELSVTVLPELALFTRFRFLDDGNDVREFPIVNIFQKMLYNE